VEYGEDYCNDCKAMFLQSVERSQYHPRLVVGAMRHALTSLLPRWASVNEGEEEEDDEDDDEGEEVHDDNDDDDAKAGER
jgi:hypothetical protein